MNWPTSTIRVSVTWALFHKRNVSVKCKCKTSGFVVAKATECRWASVRLLSRQRRIRAFYTYILYFLISFFRFTFLLWNRAHSHPQTRRLRDRAPGHFLWVAPAFQWMRSFLLVWLPVAKISDAFTFGNENFRRFYRRRRQLLYLCCSMSLKNIITYVLWSTVDTRRAVIGRSNRFFNKLFNVYASAI